VGVFPLGCCAGCLFAVARPLFLWVCLVAVLVAVLGAVGCCGLGPLRLFLPCFGSLPRPARALVAVLFSFVSLVLKG